MTSEPLVLLDHVDVERGGRVVLNDMCLTLDSGLVALLGPNGSGKSTLLQTLATILPVQFGRVRVCGENIAWWRAADRARRKLGYLAQEPAALGYLSVVEACRYAAWLRLVPRSRRHAAVGDVIDALALEAVAKRRLGELSGGTRRRAHLALALVHDPQVLLMDEPTSGLDPEHRAEVRELFARLADNRLVLFTTHLAEDLVPATSRVLYLSDGAVRFDGTPAALGALGRMAQPVSNTDVDAGLRSLGML